MIFALLRSYLMQSQLWEALNYYYYNRDRKKHIIIAKYCPIFTKKQQHNNTKNKP